MLVRKRTWITSGEPKEAWVVDYVDKVEGGKRRLKTFAKKKDATAFAATATVEVRRGIHTADSASIGSFILPVWLPRKSAIGRHQRLCAFTRSIP